MGNPSVLGFLCPVGILPLLCAILSTLRMVAAGLIVCFEFVGSAIVFVFSFVIDFVIGGCCIVSEDLADVTGSDTHA